MAPTDLVRPPGKRIPFLGLELDNLSFDQAVDRILALARGPEPTYVVTPNVDHVMRFQRYPAFRQIYGDAALVLVDGMPIVWATALLGSRVRAKVSGSDLFPAVARAAAEHELSIFLLGGREGSAEACARILTERHPALRVAGTLCPPLGFHRDPEANQRVLDVVREAAPSILFIGLGCPKQENWIHRHRTELGVPVSLCVGASIDFLAGQARRAPVWMQRCGLEWFYRLAREPRRLWKRYLVDDSPFVLHVLRQWWRQHFTSRRAGGTRP